MHKIVWAAVAVSMAACVFAQQDAGPQARVKRLQKDVSLGSVSQTDFRDKENVKQQMIKISSQQDKDDPFSGIMRVTLEFTGANGDVWYGQSQRAQGNGKNSLDYTGEDLWEFTFAHGDLKYPEVTAYAVEYGFEEDRMFFPVAQRFKKVESAEQIMERNKESKNKLKIRPRSVPQRSGGDSGGE